MAPSRPLYETAIGLLAAPIDKLGNVLRKFPDEDGKARAKV
jgi:hypothetical protein